MDNYDWTIKPKNGRILFILEDMATNRPSRFILFVLMDPLSLYQKKLSGLF
jgi:hypothetical protein